MHWWARRAKERLLLQRFHHNSISFLWLSWEARPDPTLGTIFLILFVLCFGLSSLLPKKPFRPSRLSNNGNYVAFCKRPYRVACTTKLRQEHNFNPVLQISKALESIDDSPWRKLFLKPSFPKSSTSFNQPQNFGLCSMPKEVYY